MAWFGADVLKVERVDGGDITRHQLRDIPNADAAERGCKSISFPSISTGAYGYPIEDASHVALETIMELTAVYPRNQWARPRGESESPLGGAECRRSTTKQLILREQGRQ
jgi:O-acetyl-ADP-ribose deacetylase (regulator of RNase III)